MSSVLVAQVYLFYGPRKSNFFRDFTQYRSYFAVQLFTSKTQTNLWINDLDILTLTSSQQVYWQKVYK